MIQKFTSMNTSVNSNHLPAIYGKKEVKSALKSANLVLDYGCGKFFNVIKTKIEIEYSSCKLFGYDKYNQTICNNRKALDLLGRYDIVICANVLNVIAEKEVRQNIINDIIRLLNIDGVAFISVYEGDKSGIGKQSKKDCFQCNCKLSEYLSEIYEIIEVLHILHIDLKINVEMKNNLIILSKGEKL